MIYPAEPDLQVSRLAPVTVQEIITFLTQTDTDFSPPLSQRTDLKSYAEKMVKNAELIGVRQRGQLTALAAFYCNDFTSRRAYVTYLAVKRDARGAGFGSNLIRTVSRMAGEAGMRTIELQIDRARPKLIEFYRRLGFEVADSYTRYGGHPAYRLIRKLS